MALSNSIEMLKPLNPGQVLVMLYSLENFPLQCPDQWNSVSTFVSGECGENVPTASLQEVHNRLQGTPYPNHPARELFRRFLMHFARNIYLSPLGRIADFPINNWGYVPSDGEPILPLSAAEEPYRYRVQLYAHCADTLPLAGADIIDVSCGFGGGIAFLHRVYHPRLSVGIDISPNRVHCAINACSPGLDFIVGDALALPFAATQFDAVFSIESSHAYRSIEEFSGEAHRVLRTNGVLSLADVRLRSPTATLTTEIPADYFTVVREEDITPAVSAARCSERDSLVHCYGDLVRKGTADEREVEFLKLFSGLPAYGIADPLKYLQYTSLILKKR